MVEEEAVKWFTIGEIAESFNITYRDAADTFEGGVMIPELPTTEKVEEFLATAGAWFSKVLISLHLIYKSRNVTTAFMDKFVQVLKGAIIHIQTDPTHIEILTAPKDAKGVKSVILFKVVFSAIHKRNTHEMEYDLTTHLSHITNDEVDDCDEGPELSHFPIRVHAFFDLSKIHVPGNYTLH